MKSFKIFERNFVWTRTIIINSIILVLVLIIIFISLILKIEKSTLLFTLLILVFSSYLIGLIFKFGNINRIQQLQGKIIGELIFEEDCIKINGAIITLDDINKIEISGVDWYGLRKSNYLLDYNYEGGLSNGVDNLLKIEYKNNTQQKIQFQKSSACEFKEIEEIIKLYYINNKIGYLNCVDILCLSEPNQYNEFKNISKIN